MNRTTSSFICPFVVAALAGCISMADSADWPQWLGPNRDSVWAEDGVIEKFPEDGPKVVWRAPVGFGYAGPAVADGRVFVMDYQKTGGTIANDPGNRNKLEGSERVLCLDAATGEVLWSHAYDRLYSLSYAAGPRCTPAVDGGKVYALGAEGDLVCLDASNGKVVWEKDLQKTYRIRSGMWGFSGHPLVDGDTLYCLVGGEGSVAVAFDKETGEEKWRALSVGSAEPGYCPPSMITNHGRKQLLIWHPKALNGLDPATGEVQWSYPLKPAYNMSCASPRQSGDRLFVSAIGNVAVMLKLKATDSVELEWQATPKSGVFCSNSTPVFDGDVVYGCDVESSSLIAVNANTGERHWQTPVPVTNSDSDQLRHGTSFLVKNGGRYFIFSETGDLILARLSAAGYEEISRSRILEPTNEAFGRKVVWSHPAFANRCVFARNDKELVCIGLAK